MSDWGSLVAGAVFKFRGLVNFFFSGYLLAVAASLCGFGENGVTNLANAAGFVGLEELRNWTFAKYTSVVNADATFTLLILSCWTFVSC